MAVKNLLYSLGTPKKIVGEIVYKSSLSLFMSPPKNTIDAPYEVWRLTIILS